MRALGLSATFLIVLLFARAAIAAELRWDSVTTGAPITGTLHAPALPAASPATAPSVVPVVVYLKNLSLARVGQESDAVIINDLVSQGHLVVELDYQKHPKAVANALGADVLKLRDDLMKKELLADQKVDFARVFVLAEGFRLRRDVEFARDGKRVLAMDVMYPSKPAQPVPAVMEITCDNKDRMGSSSLVFCHDTLLETAQFYGFAAAMVDHPVPPPYKGIDDPMPDLIYRLKAAVRTLRATGGELGLSGKIGAIGFSRGGPMAAFLAVTNGRANLEGDGLHKETSSSVEAALIHGNRYDYLDLIPEDPMYKRFEKAWGPRETASQRWAEHGAVFYLEKAAAPMFLNTSKAESPEYQYGLKKFAERLTTLGVDHVYEVDDDARGHRVTTDPERLAEIFKFFSTHLGSR